MAKRDFRLQMLESFSGGLNLRADQFDLEEDESPDMLNVTVDPRGGVALRGGVIRRNATALANDIKGIWSFYTDGGTKQVMVNHGTKVAYSASGNFTELTNITNRTDGSRVYGITFNNVAYGVSYDQVSFKWDGSTDADLGTTINGSAGQMPKAQYIAQWNNHVWVGATYEGSDSKYRVRWSNLNEAEKWSAADYVDVDKGEAGDYITGLVSHGDRLVIFKTNSIYAIFGFDSDSFQLVNVTKDVGSIPLSSPVSTPYGVFFWHDRTGVHVYDGNRTSYLFDALKPAIDDGRITFTNPPQLAWSKNKLYVSVDYAEEGVTARRTFVYDPSLGKRGAWMATDIDAGPLHTHRPPNAETILIGGCVANTGRAIHVDDDHERVFDKYATSEANIPSYFVTPWVSTRNPIIQKRWGKPQMVTLAKSSLQLTTEIYKNYDFAQASKSFLVEIVGRTSSSIWGLNLSDGAGGVWDTATWGSAAEARVTDVKRLPTLGTGRSICMKIIGPNTNAEWQVNAIGFTYVPRRMR
jgi:hypothetical protein